MKHLLAGLLVAALLGAGCVSVPEGVDPAGIQLEGLAAEAAPLWLDPQNAPHPAFGWPTLSNPAVGENIPAWWAPIAPATLPASIAGVEHLAATNDQVKRGAGIALFGSLAIVPGYGEPTMVLDISNPAAPTVLSEIVTDKGNHRGAVVIAYPDGRLVTAISAGYGFDIWDITDPMAPVNLGQVETPLGGHKIGVVPGTPIIYNANSNGGYGTVPGPLGTDPAANLGTGKGATEIYDLSDPANPVLVQEFQNGYGCHHIYFWIDAQQDKSRATCAGIEYFQIWDIADPLNPEVIVSIPVFHGVNPLPSYSTYLNFAHFAILNDDGTILIVGDETGGGGLPPGCDKRVDTAAKQVSGPFGNLYFYDVKDEKNPKLLGWIGMDALLPETTSCTAHHGRLVPDPEGRDMLAMAFYGAGVALIDFSDPTDPRVVDQWADASNTWEVWYYNGYLFTGDLARGLDVLTLA